MDAEAKYQNLEVNAEHAEIVAHNLNRLLESGIVRAKDISRASSSSLDEFIFRYLLPLEKKQTDAGFPGEISRDKISRLFKKADNLGLESEYSKEQIIEQTRIMLRELNQRGQYEMEGVLIYGSLLNDHKSFLGGESPSDIDLGVVLNPNGHIQSNQELLLVDSFRPVPADLEPNRLNHMEVIEKEMNNFSSWQAQEVPALNKHPIEVSVMYDWPEFQALLDQRTQVSSIFPWGFNSNGVYFVAANPELEAEYNRRIKELLNSPTVKNYIEAHRRLILNSLGD